MPEPILEALEVDLRALSAEARRSDGVAGHISGWFSGPEHPQIKEAAERTMLRLRSLSGQEDELDAARTSKEALRPFLLACESKSTKLASIALVSMQKLLASGIVPLEDMLAIIKALEQVEKLRDDIIQLKILQTALSLMQSRVLAESEEGVAAVLGLCFRLLSDPKNSDSVVNTAAATVRQAVTLVFEHVLPEGPRRNTSEVAEVPPANGNRQVPLRTESGLLAEHGSANAALKLLDELCMMATASTEAMLKWLRAPTLPRYFVLDLLDFVLSNTATVFRTVPAFEHALLVRITQLLITQLQNLLDPACEPGVQATDLRITLRVVRTVLSRFHRQLRSKCGVFIEALLAGAQAPCTLWQRINVMQVMRTLCSDRAILFFLFTSYDMRQDCKLNAVEEMVRCFSSMLESTVRGGREDELVSTMSGLLQGSSMPGKDWLMDSEVGSASPETGLACLAMLAVDSLLGVVSALEGLTDRALDGQESGTPSATSSDSLRAASEAACVAMVTATWSLVLPALSLLLGKASGEVLVLKLLRGYQSFTQASGLLQLHEPRDAFLASLCTYTLAGSELASLEPSSGPLSPRPGKGNKDVQRTASLTARNSGPEAVEVVVLSPKNVQALRTLFNVAHRLHHLLGSAWVLVLDNLSSLDRILDAPSTTTQEVSVQSAGAHSSDLAILAVAARQLFESTREMATDAVVSILVSLRVVSARTLPQAAQQPGAPKLFSLARMVDVLLYNLHRIHNLWPIFLDHLVELLSDGRPSVRAAATDAVGQAVGGALAHVTAGGKDVAEASPNTMRAAAAAAAPFEAGEDGGAAEHMLMVALETLFKDAAEVDVQLGLLRVVLQILQRHGEQLKAGWPPVLKLLEVVPAGQGAATIGLAFQSVQLVASDYMSSLPPQLLRTCLSLATLYAGQQVDMNVSLTAISLLWNAADLLSKLSRAPASPEGPAAASLDAAQFEELLRILFIALQQVSVDIRPEVRNSAVRTLYSVVASHGAHLSAAAWDEALWEILFPLLRTVHQMAATSSREEAQAEILGKVKGQSVAMLVHHSRNSEQKQWDETLVLALSGIGRLLRLHLLLIASMEAFPQGWEELMLVVESALAGGRKEVALAAIAVVTQMMQAHGDSPAMQRFMWKRALRAVGVGVEAACSPHCLLPVQARLELVNAIGQLYIALGDVLDPADLSDMYSWVERLARNPLAADDSLPVVSGILPPVQKAAISLLPTLVPPQHLLELWPELVVTLLRLIRPNLLSTPAAPLSSSFNSSNINKHALSSLAQERVLDTVAQLYRDQVPWEARAATFPAVVQALAECLALRFTLPGATLWRSAVSALIIIVSAGIPAINIAAVNEEAPLPPGCWSALADAFEAFLLAAHVDERAADSAEALEPADNGSLSGLPNGGGLMSSGGRSPVLGNGQPDVQDGTDPRSQQDDADLEATVLDNLTDTVLTACPRATTAEQHRLVSIVDQGIARPHSLDMPGSPAGSRFRQQCLRKMYVLCGRGVESQGPHSCQLKVAQLALPLFVHRAAAILTAWATEGQQQRTDLDELLCLLEVLQLMQLPAAVADAIIAQDSGLQRAVAVCRAKTSVHAEGRERSHLLFLYQPLVRCIMSAETGVRELLQSLLQLAGAELALPQA